MKKIIGLLFAVFFVFALLPAKASFASDIENHQMQTELAYWANKGVLLPDTNGNYNPNKNVTRGEFASYISRALQLPANDTYTFKDIKTGTTLANEISAAAAANIISGYTDGTFNPNAYITRQHMAAMLYKALRYQNVPLKSTTLTFLDTNKISKDFQSAVATSVYYNIIRGSETKSGISFNPQNNATIAQAAAFLYRMKTTVTTNSSPTVPNGGTVTTPPVEKEPVVDTRSYYYVGSVVDGKVSKKTTKYITYEEAEAAYTSNKSNTLLLKEDTILKSRAGALVYAANTTSGGDITTIYLDKTLKKSFTYVVEGSELDYLGSNENYVIVKVGDVTGYAKPSTVVIQPLSTVVNRSFYTVSNGRLLHKIYNHTTQKYSGEYQTGTAPKFMVAGQKYYSFDSVHFTNTSGKDVGTYFNYYQFASIRKFTEYTAAELDNIINTQLKERESVSSTYKDATTKSKLVGLGTFLKEVEAEYKVNALFILAAAIHESDYGMSKNAQDKNNLFGITVFDSSPESGSKYALPQDSIYAFLKEYINKKYVPQSGSYANGAVPGMKNTGVNVSYASDPYWGSKIAGHMFRIDEKFGKKEYLSAASVGMVIANDSAVKTYIEPLTTVTSTYSYKVKPTGDSGIFGYPVNILEEQKATDGQTWYKIFSDNAPQIGDFTRYVWVQAKYVKKITLQ